MTAQLHFTAIFFAAGPNSSWQAGGPEDAPTNADEFVFDDGTDQWREPTDEEREIAVDASVGLAALLHPVINLADKQVVTDLLEALDRANDDLVSLRDSGHFDDPEVAGVPAQLDRWEALSAALRGSQPTSRTGIGSVATPGREYPESTVYTDHDLFYVPFVAEDGRVGYRVGYSVPADTDERASRETFVYLNPSTSVDTDGSGDVFMYVGNENDPASDEPVVFAAMDDKAFGAA